MLVRFWRDAHARQDYEDFPFPDWAKMSVIEDYIESVYPGIDWDDCSYNTMTDDKSEYHPYRLVSHLTKAGENPAWITEVPIVSPALLKYCMKDANAMEWLPYREIKAWWIFCRTNFESRYRYRGFFESKEDAERFVAWDSNKTLQVDSISEATIELIPGNRIIVNADDYVFKPKPSITKIEDLLLKFEGDNKLIGEMFALPSSS